ncbi:hypothetical protein E2C01_073308 [Portunus trituberculatus]|uniref:Uncharacterized protein n=1 Tax=Portunus trituberculatus TaxID=210409 RepID=A0A5B7I2H4_PORTR|nr:hypothetical protein [Portunus trituberculatus]
MLNAGPKTRSFSSLRFFEGLHMCCLCKPLLSSHWCSPGVVLLLVPPSFTPLTLLLFPIQMMTMIRINSMMMMMMMMIRMNSMMMMMNMMMMMMMMMVMMMMMMMVMMMIMMI